MDNKEFNQSSEKEQNQTSTSIASNVNSNERENQSNQTSFNLPKKSNMFNSEEQVISNIKKEKEGNPLVVVLFLLILGVFIFFLPTIEKQFNKTDTPLEKEKPVVTPPPSIEKEKNLGFHEKGYIGNLEITNLVTTYFNGNYELSFTIINNGNSAYTFNKKYYVVLYNEDKILYRALLHSYTPLASKSSIELSLIINENAYNLANRYQIQEIQTSMYPKVSLTKEEGEFKVLTCSYQTNTLQYYFQNDTLYKIRDDFHKNSIETVNYEQEKERYRILSDSYKTIVGMHSTFIETPLDFRLINEFQLGDIEDISLANLKVYKYFRFRENVDVVAFEMESIGYTCS